MPGASDAYALDEPHFERVPAATGSLLRAWLAVGRPYRGEDRWQRAIAAWAGATTASWVILSLVATFAIDFLSAYVGAVYGVQHGRLSTHPPTGEGLLNLALGPLYHQVAVFAIAIAVAFVTAVFGYGSIPARFQRLMRPWALVQVTVSIAGLLYAVMQPPLSLWGAGTLLEVAPLFLATCVGWYGLRPAYAAINVGAYRFTNGNFVRLVVAATWLVVTAAYVFGILGLEHALGIRR